jgi:hypothetical protein
MPNIVLFAKTEGDDLPDALLTPWSIVHFLSGAVANSWFDLKFWPWEAIHAAYEIKDRIQHDKGEYNSITNSASDQIISGVGHYFGNYTGKRSGLLLFGTLATLSFVVWNEELG